MGERARAAPVPPGSAALRHAAIALPDAGERDRVLGRLDDHGAIVHTIPEGPAVHDPSGIALVFTVAGEARGG